MGKFRQFLKALSARHTKSIVLLIFQIIESLCPAGAPFYLGGYSYGAVVAQELALQLQEKQKTCPRSVILLDCSHNWASVICIKLYHANINSNEDLEIVAQKFMFGEMFGNIWKVRKRNDKNER